MPSISPSLSKIDLPTVKMAVDRSLYVSDNHFHPEVTDLYIGTDKNRKPSTLAYRWLFVTDCGGILQDLPCSCQAQDHLHFARPADLS